MRVELLTPMSGPHDVPARYTNFSPGTIVDISVEDARRMIDRGLARPITEPLNDSAAINHTLSDNMMRKAAARRIR